VVKKMLDAREFIDAREPPWHGVRGTLYGSTAIPGPGYRRWEREEVSQSLPVEEA
jgi:hypothetical protein